MDKCPKCGADKLNDIECVACGIIFSKYTKMLKEKELERIEKEKILEEKELKRLEKEKKKKSSPSKKKKYIAPILVTSIVVSLVISFICYKIYMGYERKEADKKFNLMVNSISSDLKSMAILSDDVVSDIQRNWYNAIFSEEFKDMDFNEAILLTKLKWKDSIATLKITSSRIALTLKEMTPPESKKKDFYRLKEIYLLYDKYASMAIDPTGSYKSYSQQQNVLQQEVLSASKELEMMTN